jgi:hypothetical protein
VATHLNENKTSIRPSFNSRNVLLIECTFLVSFEKKVWSGKETESEVIEYVTVLKTSKIVETESKTVEYMATRGTTYLAPTTYLAMRATDLAPGTTVVRAILLGLMPTGWVVSTQSFIRDFDLCSLFSPANWMTKMTHLHKHEEMQDDVRV